MTTIQDYELGLIRYLNLPIEYGSNKYHKLDWDQVEDRVLIRIVLENQRLKLLVDKYRMEKTK